MFLLHIKKVDKSIGPGWILWQVKEEIAQGLTKTFEPSLATKYVLPLFKISGKDEPGVLVSASECWRDYILSLKAKFVKLYYIRYAFTFGLEGGSGLYP